MPNNEHSTTAPSHAPGSNQKDSPTGVQLSANTRTRLAKLARWRIDPALLKFPKCGASFEGGYAIVSKALLGSSSDETREQVVEPNGRYLQSNNPIVKLRGGGGCQEAEETNEEEKREDKEGVEALAQESDDETSGPWKPVAVKKMKLKTQDDTVRILGELSFAQFTLREAEFLVKLSHQNVIKLEGIVEDVSNGVIWLVFPWEGNGTLKDFVASQGWEIPERISLINDVAKGVAHLHSRNPPISHGDLKSINILVNSEYRAVITDFGSARHPVVNRPNKKREQTDTEFQPAPSLKATLDPSTNTITLTCNHYTLRWAAPELLQEDDASLACDIWAFGWVAYEAHKLALEKVITDSIPFQDVKDAMVIKRIAKGDLPSISSDARMLLMQALCSLVEHCWSFDPSRRPTAEECRNAIHWMPMIIPNPLRAADAVNQTGDSAELLIQLGNMYRDQSDYPRASNYYTRALSVYSDIADTKGKANALLEIAQIQRLQLEDSQATTSYSEALKVYIAIVDDHGRARVRWGVAELHWSRNEYDQAIKLYSESLQIYTDVDDKGGRATALWGLARVHRCQRDYNRAVKFYSESLQIRTELGDRLGRIEAFWGLAEVYRLQKEYSQAMILLADALIIAIEIGNKYLKAFILHYTARVHYDQRDYKNAIYHCEQAAVVYKQIGHANEGVVLKRAAALRQSIDKTA
ncbi:hypothetical protein FS837_010148 [Tulasnella sp. UAMH 9824]|nr:hypothetical protein FS837_010148 [Tulasnella sp. UAMH 9824]